jgi:hypothetical protein
MELLRRALLVGCLLSGLWLVRLAPLEPVLTIAPFDFARQQRQEAASVPDAQKTDAQKRRAEIPLSVYIEEFLQFNIFSATGPEWERFLTTVDEHAKQTGAGAGMFLRGDEVPIDMVAGKLAAGGGTTYVSFSRPGGDVHYRVARHQWTRQDFHLGQGFTGAPTPPPSMLYPFRVLGLVCVVVGAMFFLLLPSLDEPAWRLRGQELAGLITGVAAFALPLFAVGGSVQALTRAPLLTTPCWIVTAIGMHVFAAPLRTAPNPLVATAASGAHVRLNAVFVREGLVFLLMALGPLAFLIWATLILWNR